MIEKRFRVQEHCLRSSYGIEAENWLVTNDNHSVVLNDKAEAHMVANMCNDVIDVLNALHEENVKLQARNKYLATKIQRERNIHVKEHEKWEEEIQKENEQLKHQNELLEEELLQCKAVIDNRWSEYLKKKELQE